VSVLESRVENAVVIWWRNQGGLQVKLNLRGQRGWPDRMFLKPDGKHIYIEFKRIGEIERPLQKYMHDKLRDLGNEVYVCDSVASAKTVLGSP
jgi:hypothetical protein